MCKKLCLGSLQYDLVGFSLNATEALSSRWQPHFHGNRVADSQNTSAIDKTIYEVAGRGGNNVRSIKAPTCPSARVSPGLFPRRRRKRTGGDIYESATAVLAHSCSCQFIINSTRLALCRQASFIFLATDDRDEEILFRARFFLPGNLRRDDQSTLWRAVNQRDNCAIVQNLLFLFARNLCKNHGFLTRDD